MVIYEPKKLLLEWASKGLFGSPDRFDEKDTVIGIAKNGRIICAVVYTNYRIDTFCNPLSIELSIYSIDKTWATRQNISTFFKYPFIQLGLKRVQTVCSARDDGVIMFNQRLGFKQEGIHPEAFPDGGDAISFGMLKGDCKWL